MGDVYGINRDNRVYRRTGITEFSPMGSGWEQVTQYANHVTTGVNGQYLLINGAIMESDKGINAGEFSNCTKHFITHHSY